MLRSVLVVLLVLGCGVLRAQEEDPFAGLVFEGSAAAEEAEATEGEGPLEGLVFGGAKSEAVDKTGDPFASRERIYYLGLSLLQNSIGGDFTGDDAFISSDGLEAIIVPKIDPAMGFGLVFGLRWPEHKSELRISATSVNHKGDWMGFSADTNYFEMNFEGKLIPTMKEEDVNGYFLYGLSMQTLTVEDGATDGMGRFKDAGYMGMAFILGGGVEFIVNKKAIIFIDAGYYISSYNSGRGMGTEYMSLDKSLGANSLNLRSGVGFLF